MAESKSRGVVTEDVRRVEGRNNQGYQLSVNWENAKTMSRVQYLWAAAAFGAAAFDLFASGGASLPVFMSIVGTLLVAAGLWGSIKKYNIVNELGRSEVYQERDARLTRQLEI